MNESLPWFNFGLMQAPKQKLMQFVNIFHLLNHGWLLIEFESFKVLYALLNVKNNPIEHWTNKKGRKYGCGMAKNMHDVMLKNTKNVVKSYTFLFQM